MLLLDTIFILLNSRGTPFYLLFMGNNIVSHLQSLVKPPSNFPTTLPTTVHPPCSCTRPSRYSNATTTSCLDEEESVVWPQKAVPTSRLVRIAIVELTHSSKVRFRPCGRGISAMSAGADEFEVGAFDGKDAVLLYPSSASAKVLARYH